MLARDLTGRITGLALLATGSLLPMQGAADPLRLVDPAGLAQSERLRLRAWGDALARVPGHPGLTARMRDEMTRQGYFHDRGRPAVVDHRLQTNPLLAFDGNINGGVLQNSFTIDGWVFEADPAWRAKAGVVFGAGVSGATRLAWSTGRVLELSGAFEAGWSPEHRIGRGDASLMLCARNHVAGWTFLDFCGMGTRSWRELGHNSAYRLSVRASQLVAGRDSLHELGIGAERVSTSGGPQSRLTLSTESLFPGAVTEAALTLGAPVGGTTVLRQRASAGIGWIAAGRAWRLDAWHQRLSGGAFLGIPRADRVSGAGMSVALRPEINLRLGVLDSRSTAGIANYRQITLDLRFGSWRPWR